MTSNFSADDRCPLWRLLRGYTGCHPERIGNQQIGGCGTYNVSHEIVSDRRRIVIENLERIVVGTVLFDAERAGDGGIRKELLPAET